MVDTGVMIDFDKCTYCMECVDSCRDNVLVEEDGEVIANRDKCQMCASCLNVCDEDAISIVLRNGYIERSSN